jgi:hypothetical protein
MSNVTVKFSKVVYVADSYVRVRSEQGKLITVTAPHDKTLKMKEPFCGEGMLVCPSAMAK